MGNPFDDKRLTLLGLLVESYAGLRDLLEHQLAEGCDLSMQSFEILIRLARSPGHRLRMSDLAAQTTLTPSGLTRAIDRLTAAGLVVRAACPSDRRGSFAELTREGVSQVRRMIPKHLAHVEEHFAGLLNEREQEQLEGLLRKIRDHVKPGATSGT